MDTLDETAEEPYYVYLYRDPRTREVRYVGKGKGGRSEKHLVDSHNAGLNAWVEKLRAQKRPPVVESFPCATEEQAFAVEAALISALWGISGTKKTPMLFNTVQGRRRRFCPLGLPQELARQQHKAPLTRHDLVDAGGALVVYISQEDLLLDERRSAMPRRNLTDEEVRKRVVKWWQIGGHVAAWSRNPTSSPKLLIGVTGPPERRWIWGSMSIKTKAWPRAVRERGGLYEVPVRARPGVNSAKLRGRLVGKGELGPVKGSNGRQFNGITPEFFDVVQ